MALRIQLQTNLAPDNVPPEVLEQRSFAMPGIAGHVSREMLAHYSHIRTRAKREAVATLETSQPASQVAGNEMRPN
jgi:hypothetical protein